MGNTAINRLDYYAFNFVMFCLVEIHISILWLISEFVSEVCIAAMVLVSEGAISNSFKWL